MQKNILIVGLTLVILFIGFCGCTEENALSELGWSNEQFGIGINPPEGWTVDNNDAFGVVRFTGPIQDEFAANLGISEPAVFAAGETLSSAITEMIEGYPTIFTDFVTVSSNARTVNGLNAYDLVYTFTQGIYNLTGKQVLVEKDGTVCILTYTASENSYDVYDSIVEQSISSFTMI